MLDNRELQRARDPGRPGACRTRRSRSKGWVRTRRDSRAGISFVHVSDGSSFHPVQVVAPNTLPNYTDEVLKLTAGCAGRGDRDDRAVAGEGAALRDAGERASR